MESLSLPDSPGMLVAGSTAASAGGYSSSRLPDDGPAQQSGVAQSNASTPQGAAKQTSRILGIIPNFRAVSADTKLPPQSVKDKFVTASEDSFDYSSIVLPTFLAAESYWTDATPEFGKGGVGFGRYEWHSLVDQTSENYWVEFIVPAIAHEDTRYYTLGKGGFKKRAFYSLSRIVVTRDDAGKEVFNSGEILGAGLGSAVSNLYYPAPERTIGNTMTKYATNVGIDAFTFFFKEFWPEINRDVLHGHGGGE